MRAKISRFKHNKAADNVIQEGKALFDQIKGRWQELYFNNDNPICLELACGYGEYTTGMAELFADKNFVGVDIKGDRLWQGSSLAFDKGLTNVAFLRTLVHDLDMYFYRNEVNEVWLTFPDPRRKNKDRRRRLTSKKFIDLYKDVLVAGGWFKLKTDDAGLIEYTLNELSLRNDIIDLEYTLDLSSSTLIDDHYGITTRFEEHFTEKGVAIKYLKFKFE